LVVGHPVSFPGIVPEFDYRQVQVAESSYFVGVAGEGPALLLLHGFPENQYCWRKVAPQLTRRHTVVLCDLKGYGASHAPAGGPLGEGYSKRELAAELVQVMEEVGFERFAVVGHDRGARVAYRMALDAPERVARLCTLNIIPTVEQFERMAADVALDYYPWFLMAQPPPFSERVVGASAEYVVRHILDTWTAAGGVIAPDAVERYVRAFTPEAIARMCAEFRAAFHVDRPMDAEDRRAGRTIACPVLVHWGAEEGALSDGPLDVWRRWADDVRGGPLRSGHFIPEEAPEALTASLQGFLTEAG
jgi:haloacetate dehalogenase